MPYEPCRTRSQMRNRGTMEVNGQYQVTVPDPDALDRLRTRNHMYDRTLQPRESLAGGNPTGIRSLPASSRESSTEPMDTDEGARTTGEIAENIRMAQGRIRAGSVGHVPRDLALPYAGDQESRRARPRAVGEGSPRREATHRMGQEEGPSLLQIPLCVTAGPTEEEDPSLHRPALADATYDLDRRPRNEGARPKTGPRFSTQTIGEEEGGLKGGADFYLPLPGQPRVSEVCSWRAPIKTEQGNPGVYVQIDEWQERYGGNVYVVDGVTRRIYVMKGDLLERVPEVASRRRREDAEVSTPFRSQGRGGDTGIPEIRNTPVPVAESMRQNPHTPGGEAPRADQEGLSFARLAEVTQIRKPSPQADTAGPGTDVHPSQGAERESRSPVPTNLRKERQITLLRNHVSALRRERDRKEATLLNQHIHRASAEHLRDNALEVLREATLEEYEQLLERELQPMLDFFEQIDEELIEVILLEEEEDPNFDYPGDYDWKEGDYMWLLFKIQRHFAHREIWSGVYGFLGRTHPQRRATNRQAMIELTESWQREFDKAIHIKKRAHRYLSKGGRGDQHGPKVEQPPLDTLVPPNVPTMDEPRRLREEGHSKEGVKSPASRERTKVDSREAAVEVVRKMTASDSSLESSARSGHGERPGGDWDPTYDGFLPRDGGGQVAAHSVPHPG